MSAVGAAVCYGLWIVAAADDYDGGVKPVAAIGTGFLTWAFALTFVVSLTLLIGRVVRRRW